MVPDIEQSLNPGELKLVRELSGITWAGMPNALDRALKEVWGGWLYLLYQSSFIRRARDLIALT